MTVASPGTTLENESEGHIVSKCGLYCDTCPAFQNGLCDGCPKLDMGDCVVRDCAHRLEIDSCHDCELDSCYHFEAYTARRQLMRERTKILMAKYKAAGIDTTQLQGGCGSGGGCGSQKGASGGCSGCSSAGSCGAAKVIETLANME